MTNTFLTVLRRSKNVKKTGRVLLTFIDSYTQMRDCIISKSRKEKLNSRSVPDGYGYMELSPYSMI